MVRSKINYGIQLLTIQETNEISHSTRAARGREDILHVWVGLFPQGDHLAIRQLAELLTASEAALGQAQVVA